MKLGKLPPVHDPRTLRFARYLDRSALPPLPEAQKWGTDVKQWKTLANDRLGDCAIADPAHGLMSWLYSDKNPWDAYDHCVIKAYSDVSGYDPRTGRNDNGCNMLAVQRYWRNTGICGRKILVFASVQPSDHGQMVAGIYLFGGVSLGFALPLAWRGKNVWQAPSGHASGQWQPGSWGGHAVRAVGYDANYVYVVTWGSIMPVEWKALDVYADEGYVQFSADWLGADLKAPNGFDWSALSADFKDATGQQGPPSPQPPPSPPPPPPGPTPPPSPGGPYVIKITCTQNPGNVIATL